jgi:ring-1,2-phenylacetyl-CoA epoxidase subunit PaaA
MKHLEVERREQGYDFREPDWNEFFEVLKGNGPMQQANGLEARVKAWDDGEWFRDGLNAYADKAADRRQAASVAAE